MWKGKTTVRLIRFPFFQVIREMRNFSCKKMLRNPWPQQTVKAGSLFFASDSTFSMKWCSSKEDRPGNRTAKTRISPETEKTGIFGASVFKDRCWLGKWLSQNGSQDTSCTCCRVLQRSSVMQAAHFTIVQKVHATISVVVIIRKSGFGGSTDEMRTRVVRRKPPNFLSLGLRQLVLPGWLCQY